MEIVIVDKTYQPNEDEILFKAQAVYDVDPEDFSDLEDFEGSMDEMEEEFYSRLPDPIQFFVVQHNGESDEEIQDFIYENLADAISDATGFCVSSLHSERV